jgi:hypothetical protein
MLPSDFFRRNVVLSFQEDAIDNMMWGSDYRHSESTFPPIAEDSGGDPGRVPNDEQAKPAPDHDPGIAGGNTARMYHFGVAKLTVPA